MTTSLDFYSDGALIAAIDRAGTCLISNMDTNNVVSFLDTGTIGIRMKSQLSILHYCTKSLDSDGRCQWSSNSGEPLLYVKHHLNDLNILDAVRNCFILKETFELDNNDGEGCNKFFSLITLFSPDYNSQKNGSIYHNE